MRMVVDLPAPFGPRKPVTLPGWMVAEMSLTAVLAPYVLVRRSSWIMATSLLMRAGCDVIDSRVRSAEADGRGTEVPRHPLRQTDHGSERSTARRAPARRARAPLRRGSRRPGGAARPAPGWRRARRASRPAARAFASGAGYMPGDQVLGDLVAARRPRRPAAPRSTAATNGCEHAPCRPRAGSRDRCSARSCSARVSVPNTESHAACLPSSVGMRGRAPGRRTGRRWRCCRPPAPRRSRRCPAAPPATRAISSSQREVGVDRRGRRAWSSRRAGPRRWRAARRSTPARRRT